MNGKWKRTTSNAFLKIYLLLSNFFFRVLIIIASIIIALTINDLNYFNFFENSFRILSRRQFKVFANSESEKTFTDIQNVDVDFDDNENDKRFNCVKCCQISFDCCRVTNVTCARCARQKIVCVSIHFRFVFWGFFLIVINFNSFKTNRLSINWCARRDLC